MKDDKQAAATAQPILSTTEFAALQSKYGKLYVVDIEIDEEEKYQFIVRRPTRALLESVAANRDDITKVNDLLLKNLVVAGNLALTEDGIVYTALMKRLAEIMDLGKSFLTKA